MQTKYDRCPNCMQALQNGEDICPYCNFDAAGYVEKANCLKPFTVLENKYMLGRVLGIGGFGITYIGWDLNLQTYIAIKEYFPESLATRDLGQSQTVIPNETTKEVYDKGLKRYVEEAQNISRFYQLQGIVSVKDFFYENGTAYIVMEYINGVNLKDYLKNYGGRLDEATVLALMKPVFESLYQIHNSGLVHRDISPDNIMVDKDGKIKLIDFGSARGQSAESEKTYTVILKHGYAPSEQYYAKGNQGPWTDIYSLCATMYKMLTGNIPPNSVERMETDLYQSPSQLGIPVSQRTEYVLSRGLAVKATDRYQNIGELLTDLYGEAPVARQGSGVVPIAAVSDAAKPSSISNMSMHITVPEATGQGGKNNKNSKKNMFIIIGIIAVALIIGLIVFLALRKDDDEGNKDNTTQSATEATTDASTDTATDTEEPSTEDIVSEGYKYEWPTELSDNWQDYQLDLNGTIYQFPIPYGEWKTKGWKSDYLPTALAAGDMTFASFYMDGIEVNAYVANFGFSEADIEDCFIVGLSVDDDDISADFQITMAGGIKIRESSEQDIKAAFGAPDYRYDNKDEDESKKSISLDYAGDTYDDGMDLELNGNDKLKSIRLVNTKVPDGFNSGVENISTEPPAINALYQAPDGPAQDRMDNIVTINGISYKVPVPASVLAADGWILDTATDDYILGDTYIDTYMLKDGSRIEVELYNYTTDAMLPINAYVTEICVTEGYMDMEVIFPGGMKLGMTGADFEAGFADLGDDYSVSDYGSTAYYYAYMEMEEKSFNDACLSATTRPEEGDVIYQIGYKYRPDKIK